MASVCGCARGRAGPSSPAVGARAAVGSQPELSIPFVLPRELRLRTADEFATTVRSGRRRSTPLLLVSAVFDGTPPPSRVGFVVNKAVGIAVVRNRVKRRLRAGTASLVPFLPGGSVVVRALPLAASASFPELTADLDRCLQSLRAGAR